MAKSISLKLDEKIFAAVEKWAKQSGKSRNKYINEAVRQYNKKQEREALKEQMGKASLLVREESMKVLAEFGALEDDYEAI